MRLAYDALTDHTVEAREPIIEVEYRERAKPDLGIGDNAAGPHLVFDPTVDRAPVAKHLRSRAALAGSALIGIVGGVMNADVWLALAASCAGFIGAMFDSLLGASVQSIYFCPSCDRETERHPEHSCGAQTQPLRGWRWLNNDGVNFAASLVGAAVAMGIWSLSRA